ncbi:hypothetical protein SO802_032807 [Lithocarpus litseifolius]|uniref:RNase H type-1 domain-containing protein n=1 Tax=Lithocarpus litseifolius TaxID=425828 RepID=A0AAW2BD89_9ROSI
MLARDVISNGARWRIGDGKDIRIWQHRWIASSGSGKVLSPRLDQSLDVVQDLFIPGTKTWDSEIIDRLFLPWEAESIKSIPLSDHQHSDLLIWPHTPDGCFSVRSAYRILAVAQSRDQPSSSNIEASKRLWKGVWKIEVPNKVRHFIWRAVGCFFQSSSSLFHDSLGDLGTKEQIEGASASLGFGNVVDRASALLHEFRDVQKLPLRRSVPREVVKWSPPDDGLYKVNFDGAVFEDQACAGLGVVIRDSAGLVIGALSQKIRLPSSVVMVEALAARRAVMFAREISVFGLWWRHEGNKLAHALARRAVLSADFDVWMEDLPRDLDDVFLFDLA